jgi:two-component system LytT family sensor kinase
MDVIRGGSPHQTESLPVRPLLGVERDKNGVKQAEINWTLPMPRRVVPLSLMTRKRWRQVAAILGPWTLFGLYSGAETHYRASFGKMPYSWGEAVLLEGTYCYLWALFTPLITMLARRYRIERNGLARSLSVHLVAGAAFSLLTKTAWDLAFERSGPRAIVPFAWPKYFLSMSAGFTEGLTLYWLIILFVYSIDYYRKYQAGVVQASQLQTQLVQAQLQALKMQLHPHFLFNTLHSISALVHEDPEAADRMIARLSELLRLSLDSGRVQQVPLCQELRFLDLYLAIEKMRFEERLEVFFEIEPGTPEAMVPNMILQPLVENSIRHGISSRREQGKIWISAAREGDHLVLKVTDNGTGLSSHGVTTKKQGIGLGATRGRLERLYGYSQSLILRDLREGGVEALITIPFTNAPDSEPLEAHAIH